MSSMKAKVFMNYTNLNFNCTGWFHIKPKSLCTWHHYILVFQFWLNSQNRCGQLFQPSLRFWSPALYYHSLLTSLERHCTAAIALDWVSPFIIRTPDFNQKFGPTSDCPRLIMKIKWVVPLSSIFSFIFDFFIGFSLCFSWDQCPVGCNTRTHAVLTEQSVSIETLSCFDFTN